MATNWTRMTATTAALLLALLMALPCPAATVVEVGTTYVDKGATAFDVCDGDLTHAIVLENTVNSAVLGTYSVTYRVTDSSSNVSQAVRTVRVVDTTPPVLSLTGRSQVTIEIGTPYDDDGATAQDNYDGNLSAAVRMTGSVNSDYEGTYTLTYTVSDSSGNAASPVSRTVIVEPLKADTSPLTITSPFSGATWFVPSASAMVPVTMTAACDVAVDSVQYALDGVPFGMAGSAPFEVTTVLNVASFAPGAHTLTARGLRTGTQEYVEAQAVVTIALTSAQTDVDMNGLPDNPFVALDSESDTWLGSAAEPATGGKRSTVVSRFVNDGAVPSTVPAVLFAQNASSSTRYVKATIPRGLLAANEVGVATLVVADDLATLLKADQALLMDAEPTGMALVDGGQYAFVSVITTSDGGQTFMELDRSRLAANPIRLEMAWFTPKAGETQSVYTYPATEVSNSAGVQMAVLAGDWSTSGAGNVVVASGSVQCDLTILGVVAPYETVTLIAPPAVPPVITTSSLSSGKVFKSYSSTLAASSGTPAYTWSLVSGSLPSGYSLNSSGVLSGTTWRSGTYQFTVRVTDSHGMTATKAFSLKIAGIFG